MALLERKDELNRLATAFAAARASAGVMVLISGEAGIGKTTLIRHFAAGLGSGGRVLTGHCDPLFTPAPLAPLYDIARQLDPALFAMLEGVASRPALFAAVHEKLAAARLPVVVIVEDIHWADDATLDLLKYLARRLDGLPLLLITTHRDDELTRQAPLRRLLGTLTGSNKVERLALERLSVAAVRDLAGGRPIDAEALHRQTAGNPFYVTEVIASRAQAIPQGIPVTVRDAVLARAARLSPAGLALLEHAAVIGPRMDQHFLERVAGDAATALGEGLEIGILQTVDGEVLFRHELGRDAVLESIDPIRRRRLFAQVLHEATRKTVPDRDKAAQLAHYAECAGDRAAVERYGLAAAKAAMRLGAHREAAAQYRRVLRFAEEMAPGDRADCLTQYAEQCALIDDLGSATAAYREAAALWGKAGEPYRQGAALAALAWPLVRNGRNAEGEEVCRQAVELLETLPPSRDLAAAYRIQAHLRMLDRDTDAAVRIGRQAIALAARFADHTTEAAAEIVVGAALLVSNDDTGRARLDRGLEIAAEHGLDDPSALAYLNLGSAYGEQYHFAEAERALEKGIAFARGRDLDHAGHYMTAWLAIVRMYQGRWTEAADLANEVIGNPGAAAISRIMALVALGRVRVRRGDPGSAAALDEALELAAQTGTLQRLAPVHAARAEAAWLAGDVAGARREAEAIYRMAAPRRHRWHVAEAAYWLNFCGVETEGIGWTATPFAAEIDGAFEGAAAGWAALGCPYEAARARAGGSVAEQVLALEAFDALGAAPAAVTLRRRMREAGILHVPRGSRASTREHPAGLTRRETAVLDCLSESLTNREIAAKLFIAEKTVDHHISAILAKLGATNRREAASMARAGAPTADPQNGEPGPAK